MSDQYKNENHDPQRAATEEAESRPVSNSQELYLAGKRLFKEMGFYLEPAQEGIYCGHNLYEKAHPGMLKGLHIPQDFWMYRNLIYGGSGLLTIGSTISNWGYLGKKDMYNFWSPLVSPSTRKDRPLYAVADVEIRTSSGFESAANYKYADLISINGSSGAKSFIPLREWFSEEVQQIHYSDLLTILPPAEQELFMLILGRIMVGRDESITIEGTEIKNTFRAFGILVGLEGGLGKSTLMNYIIGSLNYCGYITEAIHDLSRPFGWGKIVRSNMAYIDDLTQTSQKKLITHYLTKQIVSNGLISTEQKGIDPVSLKSRTVLMGCSNDYNPKDFYDMDDGMVSRCKLLYTYRTSELDKAERSSVTSSSPDLRIRPHWEWLAEQYNTTPTTLGCWLLCQAAEKFLDSCGYSRNDTGWVKEKTDRLEHDFKFYTNELRIQSCKQDTAYLIRMIRFLRVCSIACTGDDPKTPIHRFWGLDMVLSYLKTLLLINEHNFFAPFVTALAHDYKAHKKDPKHPYHVFKVINFESYSTALNIASKRREGDVSDADILKQLMNSILTYQGFKLVGESYWFSRFWEDACIDDEYFEDTYRRVRKYMQENTDMTSIGAFFSFFGNPNTIPPRNNPVQ